MLCVYYISMTEPDSERIPDRVQFTYAIGSTEEKGKTRESAYSDEDNQCSRLIVISIPGWCDQSSERSDAGFSIL